MRVALSWALACDQRCAGIGRALAATCVAREETWSQHCVRQVAPDVGHGLCSLGGYQRRLLQNTLPLPERPGQELADRLRFMLSSSSTRSASDSRHPQQMPHPSSSKSLTLLARRQQSQTMVPRPERVGASISSDRFSTACTAGPDIATSLIGDLKGDGSGGEGFPDGVAGRCDARPSGFERSWKRSGYSRSKAESCRASDGSPPDERTAVV